LTPSGVRFLANGQAQYARAESSVNVVLVERFWKLEGADEFPFRSRPQQTVSVLAANDHHTVTNFNREVSASIAWYLKLVDHGVGFILLTETQQAFAQARQRPWSSALVGLELACTIEMLDDAHRNLLGVAAISGLPRDQNHSRVGFGKTGLSTNREHGARRSPCRPPRWRGQFRAIPNRAAKAAFVASRHAAGSARRAATP
jgi:hypothetical protein